MSFWLQKSCDSTSTIESPSNPKSIKSNFSQSRVLSRSNNKENTNNSSSKIILHSEYKLLITLKPPKPSNPCPNITSKSPKNYYKTTKTIPNASRNFLSSTPLSKPNSSISEKIGTRKKPHSESPSSKTRLHPCTKTMTRSRPPCSFTTLSKSFSSPKKTLISKSSSKRTYCSVPKIQPPLMRSNSSKNSSFWTWFITKINTKSIGSFH